MAATVIAAVPQSTAEGIRAAVVAGADTPAVAAAGIQAEVEGVADTQAVVATLMVVGVAMLAEEATAADHIIKAY